MDPVVFVPGLLCTRELFAPQLAALTDHAATMIGDTCGDETIAGIATRILAAAPERFALCGLSMGGGISFEILRRAPERVTRLAILSSNARADTPEATRMRRELMELAQRGGLAEVSSRLLPLFLGTDRLNDPDLTALVARMARDVGKDAFLRQETALINRIDSRLTLGEISCPTLVLCGRDDVLTPVELSLEMAAAIPTATLVVLPNCGHLSTLEQPTAVNAQLLAWLKA